MRLRALGWAIGAALVVYLGITRVAGEIAELLDRHTNG